MLNARTEIISPHGNYRAPNGSTTSLPVRTAGPTIQFINSPTGYMPAFENGHIHLQPGGGVVLPRGGALKPAEGKKLVLMMNIEVPPCGVPFGTILAANPVPTRVGLPGGAVLPYGTEVPTGTRSP